MANQPSPMAPRRRQLFLLLAAIIILYVVVPQIGSFRDSLQLVANAQKDLLIPALIFTALSYVAAAGTYCFLAFHRLVYARTLLVQLAGMFVNRLIPAGIGGISVNYLYLRRSRHKPAQAASVVAANNGLGIIGHLLLLAVLLFLFHNNLPPLQLPHIANSRLIIAAAGVLLAAGSLLYWHFRTPIARNIGAFLHQLFAYRHRPARLSAALLCSIGLTLSNVLSLWFCVLAMHISLPFIAVLIVFSFGIALGTATPTPGGLGGVEAGLVAGLVFYQVDSAAALAAVLVYRLISYWLPLAAGAAALVAAQRRKYIAFGDT